ncbi:MAG: pyrroline-5-carboxylate reductase [Candidatus Pelagibacter sp.]|nr:pyrroline-5-carboxylate reductase [Candidatus Pelagibacter sp.]|tara:strand:+ start:732 stop:1502 length:771 start_codon:yes stop_codon:yes gene_type:complete
MKLGFIGTGNISSDVITGICNSKISVKSIIISPRNRKKAIKLSKKFKKVYIAKSNQEVIDKSEWIFLGVLPEVGKIILPKLNFKSKQTVVSFISTINYAQLKKTVKKNIKIVRAIPMPPISLGKGPVVIFPPDKKVKNFFNKIGTTIEIKSEKLSKNFWATSGTMASFYELLQVLSDWLVKKGLKRIQAQQYITSLYSALAELAAANSKKHLKHFVSESQTPGGLNWQGVNELRKSGYFKSLEKSINNILKRLNRV